MAAKILKGEASASEMDYELITESSLYVNEKVAENLWNHGTGYNERACCRIIHRDYRKLKKEKSSCSKNVSRNDF